MFSHVALGVADVPAARELYDAILEPLGVNLKFSGDGFSGYGPKGSPEPMFWLLPFNDKEARAGNGTNGAFFAPNRAVVDEFHHLAMSAGATDEGAPGLRQHYREHYYRAYVRDRVGNKPQAVCHSPESPT